MSEQRYCPYCQQPLEEWEAPQDTGWGILLVCNNNKCPFFRDSANDIENKGDANRFMGCRYAEDPANNYNSVNLLAVCPF